MLKFNYNFKFNYILYHDAFVKGMRLNFANTIEYSSEAVALTAAESAIEQYSDGLKWFLCFGK